MEIKSSWRHCRQMVFLNFQKTDGKAKQAKQQSRDHRAIQRRLQSAVCNEEFGDLLKFNQLRVRNSYLHRDHCLITASQFKGTSSSRNRKISFSFFPRCIPKCHQI